jgi:hypothetical protein
MEINFCPWTSDGPDIPAQKSAKAILLIRFSAGRTNVTVKK